MTDSLATLLVVAKNAWPGVELDSEAFADYVRDRLGEDETPTKSQLEELYLTCACGRGDSTAIQLFETHYFRHLPSALGKLGLGSGDIDDILQELRHKLFVPDGEGHARIDDYAGGGDLRALLRVAATRAGIDWLRRRKREVREPEDVLLDLPDSGDDPALSVLKDRYRREFELAFSEAVARRTRRQRTLLRLHILDGVGLAQLARSYGVHRSTVVRWLAAARSELLADTRKLVAEHAQLGDAEIDRLLKLVQSRLDVSIRRMLAETAQ